MSAVVYRLLADLAVTLHFGFLVFLVVGGLVSLRWRWALWLHIAAAAWGAAIVAVGQPCPLTSLERWATVRAGGPTYDTGFMDRYVEGVIYPGSLTGVVRALVAIVVVASWVLVWRSRARARALGVAPPTATGGSVVSAAGRG